MTIKSRRKPCKLSWAMLLSSACAISASAHASVLRVDVDAIGAETGQSWASAFHSIQAAISVASSGDELWIAEGFYTPVDDLTALALPSGVAVYGGFAGMESSRSERDWAAHPTIVSGDIGQDDVLSGWQGTARWYNGWSSATPNSLRIFIASNCDPTTTLDGLTIQSAWGSDGGGLRIEGGAPVIRNCTFFHNLASANGGGAIFCEGTGAIIEDCEFLENAAGLTSGGGIAIRGPALPTIQRCSFTRGMAWGYTSWQGNGGGIEMRVLDGSQPTLTITDCQFIGNQTHNFSQQAQEVRGAAGIWSYGVKLVIDRCVFIENASNDGAAITSWSSVDLSNSVFIANDATQYPITSVVSRGGLGAGLTLHGSNGGASTITNCVFSRNTADEAAAITSYGASCTLTNSIVWGNVARGFDIEPLKRQLSGIGTLRNSCVQDLLTPVPGEDPPNPGHYPGCIVSDPQFVDGAGFDAADYRILASSACIDSGRNSDVTPVMTLDLGGSPRIVRGLPGPGAAVVDIGAYEYSPPPPFCEGNANGDAVVNFDDITSVLANWLSDYAPNSGPGDANDDGTVNFDDITTVLANWLNTCP